MAKNKKRQKQILLQETPPTTYWDLLPLLFIVAVIPLIVYLKVIPLEGIVQQYRMEEINFDFFSYYKAHFLLFATLGAVIIFLLKLTQGKIKIKQLPFIYSFLGLYFLFIFLSIAFTEHKNIALRGFPDLYEGGLVLLSYAAVAFITITFVKDKKHIQYIINALFISAALIGTMGIFQFLGMDLLHSEVGKDLILPSNYKHLAEQLAFTFSRNTIYATLYNPNNVGLYATMVFALSLVLFYLTKNRRYMYVSLVISCIMFATLIGSNSRAGMVGTLCSFLLIVVFLRKIFISQWKRSLGLAALGIGFLLIFFVLNSIAGGRPLLQIDSLFPRAEADRIVLTDIVLGEDSLNFVFNKDKLIFGFDGDRLTLTNKDNKLVNFQYVEKEELNVIRDDPFPRYRFFYEDTLLYVEMHRIPLLFVYSKEGFKFFSHIRNEPVFFQEVEKWGFAGREKMGSSRGYIWSRTLPLIKRTVILGYGPDTYPMYFPQEDYLGKILYMGGPYRLIDKPHNMYLQTAVNTGLFSLVTLLAMLGIYIASCMKLYYKNDFQNYYAVAGFAVFTAVSGYLVAGIFVDSSVSVAPVFWVLFGLGAACNYLYQHEKQG